jgi:hypothetical protein
MKNRGLAIISLISLAACASGATPAPDPESPPPSSARAGRSGPQLLSADELSDPALGDADLTTVLKRLRPAFLNYRGAVSANNPEGGTTHVSIDAGPLATLDVLSTLRASQVSEVRYLSASEAAMRFGASAMAGPVIMVKRK